MIMHILSLNITSVSMYVYITCTHVCDCSLVGVETCPYVHVYRSCMMKPGFNTVCLYSPIWCSFSFKLTQRCSQNLTVTICFVQSVVWHACSCVCVLQLMLWLDFSKGSITFKVYIHGAERNIVIHVHYMYM